MAEASKTCSLCKKDLPLHHFYKYKRPWKNGEPHYYSRCNDCKVLSRRASFTSDPEKYIKVVVSQLKYSRRKRDGIECDLDAQDIINMYYEQKGRCALSGVRMTHYRDGRGKCFTNISIDRIEPEQEYTLDNIQLVCAGINMMKGTLNDDEFIQACKEVSDYDGGH